MKMLDGNIRLRIKRIIPVICIMLLLFAFNIISDYCFYSQIRLDENIVNEEKLEIIASNYNKLLESGMFQDGSLWYKTPENGQIIRYVDEDETYLFDIHVHEEGVESEIFHMGTREGYMGWHERLGLQGVREGWGNFGDCKSYFYASSAHCDVFLKCWKSDGTTKVFEEMMNEIMSIVSA